MITEFFLASRYIFRGRAKHVSFISIVSCFGVALGVAALIVVISVMDGFDKDLMERLLRFNYHLVVEAKEEEELLKLKKEILKYDDVKVASLFLQTQVFVKKDAYIIPLVIRGIEFSNSSEKKNFYKYVIEEKNTDGFFVGEGLKRKFLFNNDNLLLYPLENIFKPQEAKIKGFFKIGLYEIDSNYLVADIDSVKNITSNYLLFLGIRIKDPFVAYKLKEKIVKNFAGDFFVSTWVEQNRVLFSALKLEKMAMFVILSLIVLVASFNIFATITVKVVEKIKDIGVLKSIGFTNSQILKIFSLQGLILGLIGVVGGLFFGLSLCLILKKYPLIKLPEEIYYIEKLPVSIDYKDVIIIAFVGVLLSFISSTFAAAKAAHFQPSEALRYE
ncbi:MAG: ABC transporter permease [Candidatus Omnitrophica bacterium]|nr:ABC transporter permease [Candidatus Omnitrophota bacterium]